MFRRYDANVVRTRGGVPRAWDLVLRRENDIDVFSSDGVPRARDVVIRLSDDNDT